MSSTNPDDREPIDEDDYDLLTYTEAATRLGQEIVGERARLEALTTAGDATPADVEESRQRLAALAAAAERTGRRTINDDTFERFFGYPPGRPAGHRTHRPSGRHADHVATPHSSRSLI
jgi:hypothetical protein